MNKITKKEIKAGKRLIAEFIGLRKVDWFAEETWLQYFKKPTESITKENHWKFAKGLLLDEIKYDKDWNWLMEAVDKIERDLAFRFETILNKNEYWVDVYSSHDGRTRLKRTIYSDRLTATFMAVVELIHRVQSIKNGDGEPDTFFTSQPW